MSIASNRANPAVARKIAAGIGAAVIGVALFILFFFDPVRAPIYPVCVFHRVTGFDCPTCGSLRAFHALLHGNVMDALHFNAFTVLSLPLFAWIGIRSMIGARPLKFRPMWLWLYLGALIVFGIVRELPVPVFAAFAP